MFNCEARCPGVPSWGLQTADSFVFNREARESSDFQQVTQTDLSCLRTYDSKVEWPFFPRWLLDSKAGDELVPLKVNPDRSGGVGPRVRKRRPKEFPVMQKPRSEWRKQLMGNTFAD